MPKREHRIPPRDMRPPTVSDVSQNPAEQVGPESIPPVEMTGRFSDEIDERIDSDRPSNSVPPRYAHAVIKARRETEPTVKITDRINPNPESKRLAGKQRLIRRQRYDVDEPEMLEP